MTTAALALESPTYFTHGHNEDGEEGDEDQVVYPCKGCGDILEEGKAFELAGNRWHIDCFRCNTCSTLLDSDANLLLLGDGSLICNNCTYSCNACGNKIEDLAILTGDQAFCASCFRCRNCKRKIENLRYARTSQGIFCMSCHESLMARRRKKAKPPPRQVQGGAASVPAGTGSSVEKALPSLPPGAAPLSSSSPDVETTPPSETQSGAAIGPRSPKVQQLLARKEAPSRNRQGDVLLPSDEARKEGPILPASTYGDSRPSNASADDTDDSDERGFLPMSFDPNPVPGPPPTISRKQIPRSTEFSPPTQIENRPPRDYFSGSRLSSKIAQKEGLGDERAPTPRSGSTEREAQRNIVQPKTSPHILYQEKGRHMRRDTSGNSTPLTTSVATSPIVAVGLDRVERPKPQQVDTGSYTLQQNEGFKLQEVPKTRKVSRSSSKADARTPVMVSPIDGAKKDDQLLKGTSPVLLDSPNSSVNPFDDPKRKEAPISSAASPPLKHAERPARGDSLVAAAHRSKPATPDPSTPSTVMTQQVAAAQLAPGHKRDGSASSVPSSFADAQSTMSRPNSQSKPENLPQPLHPSFDLPPPRASSRPTAPTAPSKSVANGDFIAPRAPPPPPPTESRHKPSDSISTMQSADARSEGQLSPILRSGALPKQSAESGFSMEDEMNRILRGEERPKPSQGGDGLGTSSVLRRVSNAVKHGRSFSDRGMNMSVKSPSNGSMEISSPMAMGSPSISSPTSRDGVEQTRMHLRRANQRIAELESELSSLTDKVNRSVDIKAAETELNRKRDTMVVLDTQREMVVAELESMTAHLKKAKDSNQPLHLSRLKSDVLQDFAESLQKLKDQMSTQIEDLMHRRNELTDEIGNLIQMKDKGFQEYESLSSKNAQLLEMNNQLVHNIQETYRANRDPNAPSGPANGLGIYHPGIKSDTPGPSDARNFNPLGSEASMPNLLQENEAEPATVLTMPQVVNMRKGQPRKFNWRKGGEKMAKNITKGVKATFVGDRPPGNKDGSYEIGSIGVPYNQTVQTIGGAGDQGIAQSGSRGGERTAAGFGGLFGAQKNGGLKPAGIGLGHMKDNSSTNLSASLDGSVLFGSELEARCDFEKRVVPAIVSRCIDEVEARGMDVEGVYRKSGGSGQVKTVQQGFENDGAYDISDPDLDIHAVTSALKQYFRKLPTPLITYDVYESLLEAGQVANKEKQSYNIRAALAELPEPHRNCLEYLVQHLARVMAHESENLMTPLNLAVVFAPTIMRPLSIEREMTDMQAQRIAVQALIEQHESIFGAED